MYLTHGILINDAGELVWDQARGFRVTCYSEDLTPERQEVIDNVHRILESMGMSRPPLR